MFALSGYHDIVPMEPKPGMVSMCATMRARMRAQQSRSTAERFAGCIFRLSAEPRLDARWSWAPFFLKWVMAHPAVTSVLCGTSNPDHMSDNVQAMTGPLPDRRCLKIRCSAAMGRQEVEAGHDALIAATGNAEIDVLPALRLRHRSAVYC